jgi:hypothetical protein
VFPIRLERVNNGAPDTASAPGDYDIDHGELLVFLLCLAVFSSLPGRVELAQVGDLTPVYSLTIGLLFKTTPLIRRDVN